MPRGSGFDARPIMGHLFFAATFVVAVIGWLTTFLGQAITESHSTGKGSIVGTLWFAIFLELFLIAGTFYSIGSDTIPENRFQICAFLSIVTVFSVGGVQFGIYASEGYVLAVGAGWLLLSFVNLLWLLYFTASETSTVFYILNSTSPSNFPSTSFKGSPVSGGMGGNRRNSTQRMNNTGTGIGYTVGEPEYTNVDQKMGTVGSLGMASSISVIDQQPRLEQGMGNNLNSGASIRSGGAQSLGGNGTPRQEEFTKRAKAMYAYNASPDDPNEISFAKGEVLDIIDSSGKWWQAKKVDGSTGIVPSNYLQLLE